MSRLLGQTTPTLPAPPSRPSASFRRRSADTRISPPGGSAASSARAIKESSAIFPPLTSGIDPLLEWLDAEALHRVDEKLLGPLAQRQIGLHDVLYHVGDLLELHAGPDQLPERSALVGAAADRDLIDLLAV